METGFSNSTGNVFVTTDADCTYPTDDIPKLIEVIKEDDADLVIASRFLGEIKAMGKLNYYGNIFFSKLISILTGEKITDGSSGMRALTKEVWKNIRVESKGLDWEVEMTTRTIRNGFRVKEIPIQYSDRVGASKLNPFIDGFRFFVGITKGRFL